MYKDMQCNCCTMITKELQAVEVWEFLLYNIFTCINFNVLFKNLRVWRYILLFDKVPKVNLARHFRMLF